MAAKKIASRDECSGDGLALAAGTAAASILGNIAQVIDRTKLTAQKAELREQRDRLTSILGQWQLAYNQLRMSHETQRVELGATHARIAELQRTVERLSERNLGLEQELAGLRSEGINDE